MQSELVKVEEMANQIRDRRALVDGDILLNPQLADHIMRICDIYSKADMVPVAFRGKPSDLFVVASMAIRLNVDFFMLLQNCFVIAGKVGFETKFALALLLNSGKVRPGSLKYDMAIVSNEKNEKGLDCTCSVIDAASGEEVQHTLHWKTVVAEGWLKKPGSKWCTDPRLMCQYRSALRLIRTYYPDVLLGCYTQDELTEIEPYASTGRTRSVKPSVVPDKLIGTIVEPVTQPRRPGRPRKVQQPAPPMEELPAEEPAAVSHGAFNNTLEELRVELQNVDNGEAIFDLENAALRLAETPDNELFDTRVNAVTALCDVRREEIGLI